MGLEALGVFESILQEAEVVLEAGGAVSGGPVLFELFKDSSGALDEGALFLRGGMFAVSQLLGGKDAQADDLVHFGGEGVVLESGVCEGGGCLAGDFDVLEDVEGILSAFFGGSVCVVGESDYVDGAAGPEAFEEDFSCFERLTGQEEGAAAVAVVAFVKEVLDGSGGAYGFGGFSGGVSQEVEGESFGEVRVLDFSGVPAVGRTMCESVEADTERISVSCISPVGIEEPSGAAF